MDAKSKGAAAASAREQTIKPRDPSRHSLFSHLAGSNSISWIYWGHKPAPPPDNADLPNGS
jgi:hypothetical protein